jgi:hypothetical protein
MQELFDLPFEPIPEEQISDRFRLSPMGHSGPVACALQSSC